MVGTPDQPVVTCKPVSKARQKSALDFLGVEVEPRLRHVKRRVPDIIEFPSGS